jgi:hypothetical protein
MFTKSGLAAAFNIFYTKVASAAAGHLSSIDLQDDKPNPISWVVDFFTSFADFLGVLSRNFSDGLPSSAADWVDLIMHEKGPELIDEFVASFYKMPEIGSSIFWVIILFFVGLGLFILNFKAMVYIMKIGIYANKEEYNIEAIARGRTHLTAPHYYAFVNYIPSLAAVMLTPLGILLGLYFIYELAQDFIISISGGETVGVAIYTMLIELLGDVGLIGFAAAIPWIVALFSIFLGMFAISYLGLIITTSITITQVARYGDGESPLEVLTTPIKWNFFMLIVVAIMVFWMVIGPWLMVHEPLSLFPPVIRITTILVMAMMTPLIVLAVLVLVPKATRWGTHVFLHFVAPGNYPARNENAPKVEPTGREPKDIIGILQRTMELYPLE